MRSIKLFLVSNWYWILAALVVLPALGFLIYKVYRWFFPLADKTLVDALQSVKDEIKRLSSISGQEPSFTDSQYKTYAASLFESMNGIGTNNAQVESIFGQLKKRMDVLKLIVAYGVRQLTNASFNDGPPSLLSQHLISEGAIDSANEGLLNHNVYYQF